MSFAATDYPSGALAGSGTHNVTLSGSAVPDGMLLFASLGGTETVGELFTYSIKLKTPDILNLDYVSPAANLQLKPMVGKDLCVNIELDGGGKRYISGLVTAARVAGHQGRSVVYELRLEPWLKTLTHTSDYKAFQNKNVVNILDEVLDEYPWPVEKRLVENYPTRAWQVQYGETDFDFIQRLMQEWGIYWWFEHNENSHTLVLADAINVHKACADSPLVCYYQKGLKLDKEFIHTITANESLRSGQWVLNDFDFMKPRSLLKSTVANPRETGLAEYEHYEWPGDYFTKSEGEMLTRIRMEEQRSPGSRVDDTSLAGQNKTIQAVQNLRLAAGDSIILSCGKTILQMTSDGIFNITCKNFNITATENGKINTQSGQLDLNMNDRAADIPPPGTSEKTALQLAIDVTFMNK